MHFIQNINPVLEFARKFLTRHLMCKTVLEDWVSINTLAIIIPHRKCVDQSDITLFVNTTKCINHLSLMPNLNTIIKVKNAHT